jgi:hypothetical protein
MRLVQFQERSAQCTPMYNRCSEISVSAKQFLDTAVITKQGLRAADVPIGGMVSMALMGITAAV